MFSDYKYLKRYVALGQTFTSLSKNSVPFTVGKGKHKLLSCLAVFLLSVPEKELQRG